MELYFKVTTTPDVNLTPRQYRDGDIVQVAPNGVLFSGADILAWFQSTTIPLGWSTIPAWKQRAIQRVLVRTKWLSTHTVAQIAKEWSVPLVVATAMQKQSEIERTEYLSEGIDSNWGRLDLQCGGVVRIDRITPQYVRELIDQDETETHRPELLGKRRYRIQYRNHLSAEITVALEKSGTRVEAQRSVSLPLSVIVDDPRSV